MGDLPGVRLAHNLKLIGHTYMGQHPNGGEGIAIKATPGGRRIMYIANENPPGGWNILDVTDPANPEVVRQYPVPHPDARLNSLGLYGDILLTANQVSKPGLKPAGMQLWDVSDAVNPKEIGYFDLSGPHSRGVHYVWIPEQNFVHIATGAPDFEPSDPNDHQFYMVVDISDPSKPREAGRWWMPGQRKGDKESYLKRHKDFDVGFRLHHALVYPERPDRAYMGYIDGGVIILDISRKADPKMVSRIDYHPPFPGFSHTVLPLFDRGLLVVTDEATGDHGYDWPKRIWMMDVRDETNPVMISSFPTPEGFEELHRVGGRIGAHNIHQNHPNPTSAKMRNTVAATWFTAGLRVYDIRDPFRPEEIAAFLPETPAGQRGCRISEVHVDEQGLIYAADRAKGGLYILEYTGPGKLD